MFCNSGSMHQIWIYKVKRHQCTFLYFPWEKTSSFGSWLEAQAALTSLKAWLSLLCYWCHILHYVLIISNWPVKPQQPLQCCMKALTSTNKPKDPLLVMSCRFLHHYSNNDSFSCPLGCQKFWELVLFQGAQYGACECTELGLIARRKVRAVSCPSGAEDVCGGWVRPRWWAVNGELCKWKPGWCSSVGKSGGHLNIQPQGQHSNSTPLLNMPHKVRGSDKMARSVQARICILMRLSESLWIRARSMRDHTTPQVATKQPVIAGARKTTSCSGGS